MVLGFSLLNSHWSMLIIKYLMSQKTGNKYESQVINDAGKQAVYIHLLPWFRYMTF